jgi:ribosome-associated heat shock protein Hsp15
MAPAEVRQRIDKWLWFARLAKTRTQAQALVAKGAIRINRQKIINASHVVRVGDTLTAALPAHVRVLRVVQTGERRGPSAEARLLYEEILPAEATPGTAPRPSAPVPSKRPDKRARRAIIALGRSAAGEDQ